MQSALARRHRWIKAMGGTVVVGAIGLLGTAAAEAQGTDDPAKVEAGRAVFETSCAGCHGIDGAGTDSGRSLIGIGAQEPDRSVHIASVTNGKGGMPAFASGLTGEEIDAAVTYVRLGFSGGAALDDLPRTGNSLLLPIVGASMVGLGVAAETARRRSVVR